MSAVPRAVTPTSDGGSPAPTSLGVLFVLGGIFCVLAPAVTGVGLAIAVGIGLAVAAGSSAGSIFKSDQTRTARWSAALATALLLALSLLILLNPWAAVTSLSALVAIYLFASNVRWLIVWIAEPRRWLALGAAIAAHTGAVLIVLDWPLSGEWAIGVFAGAEIIVTGGLMIASGFGRAERRGNTAAWTRAQKDS